MYVGEADVVTGYYVCALITGRQNGIKNMEKHSGVFIWKIYSDKKIILEGNKILFST